MRLKIAGAAGNHRAAVLLKLYWWRGEEAGVRKMRWCADTKKQCVYFSELCHVLLFPVPSPYPFLNPLPLPLPPTKYIDKVSLHNTHIHTQ